MLNRPHRPVRAARHLAALVLAVAACIPLAACNFQQVQGSGTAASETRTVSAFDGVRATGTIDVHVVAGPTHSVLVHADDNLLTLITTRVDGSTLVISSNGSLSAKSPLHVDITLPALKFLGATGTGDVVAEGVDADELVVKVSGTGDVLATGNASTLKVSCSGTGDAHLGGLVAGDTDVATSGTGDIDVHVTGVLNASASGTGDVTYSGSPTAVKKSATGLGDVEPR